MSSTNDEPVAMEVKNPIATPVVEMHTLYNDDGERVNEKLNLHVDDFIFESVSLHFNLLVFLKQFSAHIVLPLCFFFTNMRGQGIITQNWWVFMQNAGASFGMYVVLITYFTCTTDTQEAIAGACFIPLLFFIQHRLIISLKYATLSQHEYDKFMSCNNVELCEQYNLQMQLLSSWSERDETVLEFELGSAAVRTGAQINELFLNIWEGDPPYVKDGDGVTNQKKSNFHQWNAFIRGLHVIDVNAKLGREFFKNDLGGYSISVFDVVKAIIRKADSADANKNLVEFAILVFVFFNMMIPFIHLGTTTKHITWNASLVLFLYFSTILNFFFARVCYRILCTAVWDVLRQVDMIVTLHKMLRLSDLSDPEVTFCVNSKRDKINRDKGNVTNIMSFGIPRRRHTAKKEDGTTNDSITPPELRVSHFANHLADDNDSPQVPRLELNCPHNVVGWAYARLVIQNFGERFHFRIDTYTGGNCIIIFILMVGCLLHVILSENRAEAYKNCLFQQIVLTVFLVVAFLIFISICGAKVNDELALHSRTLAAHSLAIRNEIVESGRNGCEEQARTLEEIEGNIESVLGIIDVNTQLKPYKLFGLTCTTSITASIVSAFASFLTVLISFSKNNQLGKL